jgi:tRNA(Ile2) C34 agmatinyltransferase TiaS
LIYIGIDDTDNKTSRGTGRLARTIAASLWKRFEVRGVTRHQFLVDPRVPYTSHNSSATIHLRDDATINLAGLADEVQAILMADFQEGSDPGLCVARTAAAEMIEFGRRAKVEVVSQAEARAIAGRCGCILRGLGGTQDGVIGALAGVGLAATGEDGRFILVGRSRELTGVQTVQAILDCGISQVRTTQGHILAEGLVQTNGKLRPAFRGHQPVLYVTRQADDDPTWSPVKLD